MRRHALTQALTTVRHACMEDYLFLTIWWQCFTARLSRPNRWLTHCWMGARLAAGPSAHAQGGASGWRWALVEGLAV